MLLIGVGTPRYVSPPNASVRWQPDGFDYPHQQVVPRSQIPRSTSHTSIIMVHIITTILLLLLLVLYIYIYIYIMIICMYVCMYVCMSLRRARHAIYLSISIYLSIYRSISLYVYIYICIYTHINTMSLRRARLPTRAAALPDRRHGGLGRLSERDEWGQHPW